MDQREELFKRVRDDAEAIATFVSRGMNVPIDNYIDKTSLDALCDSLKLEPDAWEAQDLERILIIRDGLYTFRNDLRDAGDEGEYSVEQLLSATDRLYADLERAMRAVNTTELTQAQTEIAALQRTNQVDARMVPSQLSTLREEANELLTRTHVTYHRFEVNLIKINNLDVSFEVLQNAKLVVQRLSASAFAIKLTLEQRVIYEGVLKFLSEGADKIVNELRKVAEHFQRSYKQAKDFLSDLSILVEKGGRFTKHVAQFLSDIFGDKPIEQKQLRLKTRNAVGAETMLCACHIGNNAILLAGKDGYLNLLDPAAARVIDRHQVSNSTINCLAFAGDEIIAGSDQGLETINPQTLVSLEKDTIYSEKVTAVAAPHWGIVSGTRDGIIRRWKAGLQRYGSESLRMKSVQRMLVNNDVVLIAAGENLVFIDESFRVIRTMPIEFYIKDMALLSHSTLILCGDGKLAHVNLVKGIYTRFIFTSDETRYTSVAGINETTFCAGTDDGTLHAVDLLSNGEMGDAKVSFPVRGIIRAQNNLVAYGGPWQGKPKSTIAVLNWEEIVHKSKEIGP